MENYRLSSYTIFTKLEDTEDKYMLMHGYTGAIDITSENLVTAPVGITLEEAKVILGKARKEKLPIVDKAFNL